jgi:putative addiction module component (TIGR02574 family)
MATVHEIEAMAFELSESDRARLAAHLLDSLPPVLQDADEGVAEALRRNAELDANPGAGMTLNDLDDLVRRRRA